MSKGEAASRVSGDDARGYLMSALVFAGMTALWALIVRNDPYYRLTEIFGARVPVTMVAYLILMPLAGFLVGRWRYQARHRGGAAGFFIKLGARFVHFTYVHLLIVLFTFAMATDYFLGLNIDQQVRSLDDRMFEIAARFAPWLAAYLAGFNLGRAVRREPVSVDALEEPSRQFDAEGDDAGTPHIEPTFRASAFLANDALEKGDLDLHAESAGSLTMSGLASDDAPASGDTPGFLPPQDFGRLRPALSQLR